MFGSGARTFGMTLTMARIRTGRLGLLAKVASAWFVVAPGASIPAIFDLRFATEVTLAVEAIGLASG